MAIGLDFVKSVDPNWRERVRYADGEKYSSEHCPIMNGRCRKEDCIFWDKKKKVCKYIKD